MKYLLFTLILLLTNNLYSQSSYFTYSVSVGGSVYSVGDRVSWDLYAGVEGDNDGIRSFGVSLYESKNESMEAPMVETFAGFKDDGTLVFVDNFIPENYYQTGKLDTDFDYYTNKFGAANGSGGAGGVSGIGVGQFEQRLGITGGKLCEASYTVTKPGFHGLYAVHGSGVVWINGGSDTEDVLANEGPPVGFYVISAPLGTVNVSGISMSAAIVSESWDAETCSINDDFCDGADVNFDSFVDNHDLAALFKENNVELDIEEDSYKFSSIIDNEIEDDPEEESLKY